MELPGTPNDRIGDLRTKKNLSQKELCELADISPSQLSRIERGEIKNISGDILVKLAKALNTSTDYILGLTIIRTPKDYEIGELGLSEGAVKNMLLLKSNGTTPILNRLLEHKHFPLLISQIKSYFHDEIALGVMGRNELFDIATASLGDLRKDNPEKSTDIRDGIRFINSEKIGKHEIDIEKTKNTFMTILRDIKKEIGSGELDGAAITPDILKQIQSQMPETFAEPVGAEQAATAVTKMLEQAGIFDEETAKMFQAVAQSAMEKFEKASEGQTNE
jgi:Predicted transcriptional regulators